MCVYMCASISLCTIFAVFVAFVVFSCSFRVLPGNLIFLIIILLVASDSWAVAKWWRWQVLPVFWWHSSGFVESVRIWGRPPTACHATNVQMCKLLFFVVFISVYVCALYDFVIVAVVLQAIKRWIAIMACWQLI